MASFFRLFICLLFTLPGLAQPIIRVTQNGAGDQSGTSWSDALSGTALAGSVATATPGTQFWVAAGTYKPTTTADRTASFSVASGVSVYGGFVGNEVSTTDVINGANETILSGNIGDELNPLDNSKQVIQVIDASGTVLFDHLTVQDGRIIPFDGVDSGAGISMISSGVSTTVIVSNCHFRANKISRSLNGGGALFARANSSAVCTLLVHASTFTDNEAGYGGAIGLYTQGGTLTARIATSVFDRNVGIEGGAVSGRYLSAVPGNTLSITRCQFVSNQADYYGGALATGGASPTIDGCTFSKNTVTSDWGGGGAVDISGAIVSFTNCLFANNSAAYGGAVAGRNDNSMIEAFLSNCTFTENTAQLTGGAIDLYSTPFLVDRVNKLHLLNCVAWNNRAQLYPFVSESTKGMLLVLPKALINVSFSLIEGGYSGSGNIAADPQFVNPISGNFQLIANSPAINAGDPNTGDLPATDLAGQVRVQDGRVDIGAYEFTCSTTVCPPITVNRRQ